MGVASELNRVIKSINIQQLTEEDKVELLQIFLTTNDHGLRNRIALIFSDAIYNEAVPHIVNKINIKELFNYNGTLVYSLQNLESEEYFLEFIKMICEQGYEARMEAFELIKKYVPKIEKDVKKLAMKILEAHRVKEELLTSDDTYKDSALNFIEATEDLLISNNQK